LDMTIQAVLYISDVVWKPVQENISFRNSIDLFDVYIDVSPLPNPFILYVRYLTEKEYS
jgi:hypothetical protein